MNKDISTDSVRDPRIQKALNNWDNYVIQLASMSDKKLSEKLNVINMQAVIAHEKNIVASVELLEIWWRQVVEARTYKAENNIPDAPNEVELAIADIETFVAKAEQRQDTLKEFTEPVQPSRPKVKKQRGDESQLSLF